MLTQKNIDNIIEAARLAGRQEIMPHFRKLTKDKIEVKSRSDDLVTTADRRSEHLIGIAIKSIMPGAIIVAEEEVETRPELLSLVDTSDLTVVIDPIDGTWNYANGLATFGTIIAVIKNGETIFGLLYDPVLDDWIAAEKGSGAWYVSSEQRYKVTTAAPPTMLSGYIPVNLLPSVTKNKMFNVFSNFDRIAALFCSCHEYRMLAQGSVSFCVGAWLKPWDHAAGALIVEEAGGVARLLDGSTYRPGRYEGVLLTAVNEDVFQRVSSILRPVYLD